MQAFSRAAILKPRLAAFSNLMLVRPTPMMMRSSFRCYMLGQNSVQDSKLQMMQDPLFDLDELDLGIEQ